MPRFVCRMLICVAVVIAVSLPLFATRVKSSSSSQNGSGGTGNELLCPDASTPFFAKLDGTQSPPADCTYQTPYPNWVVTLAGSGFTVTITPAIWDGDGFSKATVFQVVFTGQSGMTLQSLVIGSQLNLNFGSSNLVADTQGAYVVCDPNHLSAIPDCFQSPVWDDPNSFIGLSALEPTGIALADVTTTRWDFSQFAEGNSITLVVAGFPSDFANIDNNPKSNALSAAFFVPANFLAIARDSSNNLLPPAGGLLLNAAPAAKNDLVANATEITGSPFVDFIDTSATGPQEILSGTNAGSQDVPQGDPTPTDPSQVNPGTPCNISWPTTANGIFRSVWYRFGAIANGSVTISTDGSRYDTGVYVFSGSPKSPTPVACNDDGISSSGIPIQSSDVTFTVQAGMSYYVMVSEVPPPLGTDTSGNPLANPLADDATLRFSLTGNGIIGPPGNPVPFIDGVQPPAAAPGSNVTQLVISGAGFVSGATVNFNGANLPPSKIAPNQIVVDSVEIPSGVITEPLTVTNPNITPLVGTSNVAPFPVSKPTTTMSIAATTYSTNGGGVSLIAADFNGDGKIDIVSAGVGGNNVGVLLGNGNGTFQTQHLYPTGTQPTSVVQGDFNGDGHLDLAVANESAGTVSILLGNGDGTFQTQVPYTVGTTPNGIVAGDFNGDGKLDLAVSNFGSGTVSILSGNGDGTFRSHIDYGTGPSPTSLAAGDFNGDGILDLVVAAGTNVSILLGYGDGTFKSAAPFPASTPVWVIVGDFNGDSKLDVATANGGSQTVSVFLGNGDGTLQAKKDYQTAASANSVATADTNGDGKLDLVAGTSSSTVDYFLGNGDGTFATTAKPYTSGVSNGALVLGDLNNDGRLDIVVSLGTGISVLMQTGTATLSVTKLTFPTQLIGTTSAAQNVTLSNKGTAELLISSITPSGDYSETNTCGTGIQPGGSCTISVTFTPKASGTRTGSITIKDDVNTGKQTISLTGTGTVVQLSPPSLSFGSVKVGTKSAVKKVTLTNKGTTSLSITGITVTGTNSGDFTQSNTCGTGIGAGASCMISVTFAPTATGARSASLSVADNGGGSPQTVKLSGNGT